MGSVDRIRAVYQSMLGGVIPNINPLDQIIEDMIGELTANQDFFQSGIYLAGTEFDQDRIPKLMKEGMVTSLFFNWRIDSDTSGVLEFKGRRTRDGLVEIIELNQVGASVSYPLRSGYRGTRIRRISSENEDLWESNGTGTYGNPKNFVRMRAADPQDAETIAKVDIDYYRKKTLQGLSKHEIKADELKFGGERLRDIKQ